MRDDLQVIRDKTTELEIKLDRVGGVVGACPRAAAFPHCVEDAMQDINELKSAVEKAKNDTVSSGIIA